MSAGHRHPVEPDLRHRARLEFQLDELLRDPRVIAARKAPIRVVTRYHIPLLGGSGPHGRPIYFDHCVWPKISRFRVPLTEHEDVEQALIHGLGWKYLPAHRMATVAEHRVVRLRLRTDPIHYEAEMRPEIAEVEHADVSNIPPDLDLNAYLDEPKLLAQVKAAQSRETTGTTSHGG